MSKTTKSHSSPPSRESVAHATSELNNLLQIIAGASSSIEQVTKSNRRVEKYFDMLHASIERAEKIVAQLSVQAGGTEERLALQPEIAPPSRATQTGKWMPTRQTILVVDDEQMALGLVENTLIDAGFDVVTAQSGFDCLGHFRSHPHRFAMVLLDLSLPFMDGQETFRRLRELRNDVPVVLCTGFIEQERLSEMMKAGLSGFLRKPIPPDEIVAIVRSTLESSRYTANNPNSGAISEAV